MPTFDVTISDKALAKLEALVAHHNEVTGQSLTVKQWVLRHLKEAAVSVDWAAIQAQLKEEHNDQYTTAERALFEEAIADL